MSFHTRELSYLNWIIDTYGNRWSRIEFRKNFLNGWGFHKNLNYSRSSIGFSSCIWFKRLLNIEISSSWIQSNNNSRLNSLRKLKICQSLYMFVVADSEIISCMDRSWHLTNVSNVNRSYKTNFSWFNDIIIILKSYLKVLNLEVISVCVHDWSCQIFNYVFVRSILAIGTIDCMS